MNSVATNLQSIDILRKSNIWINCYVNLKRLDDKIASIQYLAKLYWNEVFWDNL